MAYHEQADAEAIFNANRLRESLDDTKDGSADAGLWAYHIAANDMRVFSYLASRYPTYAPDGLTPATTHRLVRDLAARLTAVAVLGRRMRDPAKMHDRAIADLERLRDGLNDLGTVAAANVPASTDEDRLRDYREKGPMRHEGEPQAGEDADGTGNKFWDVPNAAEEN